MTIIIYLFIGLIIGFIITYIYFKKDNNNQNAQHQLQIKDFEISFNNTINELKIELARAKEKTDALVSELAKADYSYKEEQNKSTEFQKKTHILEQENRTLIEKLDTQKKEFEDLHKKLNSEFELIASKVIKQNSKEITDIHNKSITDIVTPLKEKIQAFEKKVEEAYDKELRDKIDLKAELKNLHELNKRISEEAQNLTKALKGDNKKQGNWGELILERVLERSGLNKGQEYVIQFSTSNDENKRIQPDVVVYLPEKKHIIIDAKVSLIAYEKLIATEAEEERQVYMKEHIMSVKNHINLLSEKKYHTTEELSSPEFVLMFMPIESSFSVALQSDNELFGYAWERKIVIVSPTTLLATLRTIASIWKQENQTKNALEIARQGGALYDKLVSFVADMEKIGKNIDSLSELHNEALKKLHSGTGNLIGRAENMRRLGAKTSKKFPDKFIAPDDENTENAVNNEN